MSTKINVRSPFYLKYSEPTLPSVALDCTTVNLENLSIDEYGNVSLPTAAYGEIVSYTSSAGDFADGKFAAVGTGTSRTITFTISIPENFSNSGDDTIDCTATATQPATSCTGGISASGSIPNQSLNTNGNSVTIDLSSYFTGGTVSGYLITNNNLDHFITSVIGDTLTITSVRKAGTNKKLLVEATDGVSANCNATQTIQVTTTAAEAWSSSDAYLSGGSISQTGTITNPSVNGTITAIKDSSGGSTITSYPANSTGSDRNVTLFFNVTVPTGYSNTGATVEVSKVFSQPTAALPTFTCSIASLTNQSITSFGAVSKGIANAGTITGFSPIGFDPVTSDTSRTVTYTITPPSSGYSNSGGSDISCAITMKQTGFSPTVGDQQWYMSVGTYYGYITYAQIDAAYPSGTTSFRRNPNNGSTLQARLEFNGYNSSTTLRPTSDTIVLSSSTAENNVNTYVFRGLITDSFPRQYTFSFVPPINKDGVQYRRISKVKDHTNTNSANTNPSKVGADFFVAITASGLISEVWFVDYQKKTFTQIA